MPAYADLSRRPVSGRRPDDLPTVRRRGRARHRHRGGGRGHIISFPVWVTVLAAAGFCTVLAVAGHTVIQNVQKGGTAVPSEPASYFESYLAPVVMQDPAPFSDIRKADADTLLCAAVWAALGADGEKTLTLTADNRELLPVSEVGAAFRSLFGTAVQPKYRTFFRNGAAYDYDAARGCFTIPMIALDDIDSPRVVKSVRQGDTVTLTVDSVPGTGWLQKADGTVSSPAARKRMIYVLAGQKGSYRIVSVAAGPPLTPVSSLPVSSRLQASSGLPASSVVAASSSLPAKTTSPGASSAAGAGTSAASTKFAASAKTGAASAGKVSVASAGKQASQSVRSGGVTGKK